MSINLNLRILGSSSDKFSQISQTLDRSLKDTKYIIDAHFSYV